MDFWLSERTPESLAKAQKLVELAERVFPESPRLLNLLDEVRERAAKL
jgi:hypothetical protein